MAQPPPEEEEQFLTSIFPAPPPFYKHFTPTNLSALKDAQEKLSPNTNDQNSNKNSKDASSSSFPTTTLTPTQLLDLPAPLREQLTYLIPPPPPDPSVEYRVFGKPTKLGGDDPFEYIMQYVRNRLWNPDTSQGLLPLWEYERLYPADPSSKSSLSREGAGDTQMTDENNNNNTQTTQQQGEGGGGGDWGTLDRQTYLFRFLRSIIIKHVELLGILATDPTAPAPPDADGNGPQVILPENPFNPGTPLYDKAKDKVLREILNLVMNMHALINEYRPHQARETLIRVLEGQVERKKKEIEGVRRMAGRVGEALEGLRGAAAAAGGGEEGGGVDGNEGEGSSSGGGGGVEKDEEKIAMREMWRALEGV
ncbi:hypothetical protein DM02DRAFT_620133 [Periconia macrospinosa]|uniref:Mediator of RNA polymerase II transcription subunit 7 n=1 Tax=Periconia macrospinosa TaxID=97972 RepID=A0A2V1D3B5_9PLEO|nr:hypothetical protein DM02DRAFT_620133 [Periconia macrospinosa]